MGNYLTCFAFLEDGDPGLHRVGLPHRLHQVGVGHARQRTLPGALPRLPPLRWQPRARATGPLARRPRTVALTAALSYLNYRVLHLVGLSALALTAFSLSPFVAFTVLAAPKIRPARWLAIDVGAVNLRGYFNSMFWNLNF